MFFPQLFYLLSLATQINNASPLTYRSQLIGTQNFFLLVRAGMFVGWWELLCRPFRSLSLMRRRGSDLPLTSLKPPTGQPVISPSKPSVTDTRDYAAGGGTTPLMMSANTSPSKPPTFSGIRRQRSASCHSSSSSSSLSLHNFSADMPPVMVANPYKLSLPSERAASLIDPAECARLARAGEMVDLHDLYAKDVRDDRAAFNAARPQTPPPPPLPLNVAKSPVMSGPSATGSPFGGARRSLATAAAPLSLPTTTSTSHTPPPAVAEPTPAGGAATRSAILHSSRSFTPSSTTHIHTPLSLTPSPSHTPDFLRSSATTANTAGPGIANRHRLPSWARSSTQSGGGLGGASTLPLTASELRDAMRGGLALHPVDMAEFGELSGGTGRVGSSEAGGGDHAGREVEERESAFSSSGSEEVVDGRRGSRGSSR